MIVRGRPSGFKLFLVLKGSILNQIWAVLLVNILLATVVTLNHGNFFKLDTTMSVVPFTLLGLPLAIFLGFRNNAAYDRYWEARKHWGELVLQSRNFSRQCLSLIECRTPIKVHEGFQDIRIRMIYRAIAFAHALRHLLRNTDAAIELKPLLEPSEWEQAVQSANIPNYLMLQMGKDLRQCIDDKKLDSYFAVAMDKTISSMSANVAACERIKNTPIPFSYTLLLHRTAYLYCFLLPFGLVDAIGYMTPFVVGIVAYTFFGLDALGYEIEEPFGDAPNDLALSAICRSIEINLRDAIGEKHELEPLAPVNYCLM